MLAMDSQGRLFVADRGNSRIQIFDQEGRYLTEWKQFGRPSGVYIDKNDNMEKTNPGFGQGIRIGSAKETAQSPPTFRRPRNSAHSKASPPTVPAISTAATRTRSTSPKAVPARSICAVGKSPGL
jgi:NHL repeat